MTKKTIREQIEDMLLAGSTPERIGAILRLDVVDSCVLFPGFVADDGYAEEYYPDAESAEKAANAYVEEGDWGETEQTEWHHIYVWREGLRLEGEKVIVEQIDEGCYTVEREPKEPECLEGEEDHAWEEISLRSSGGGVIYVDACRKCGAERTTNTWAQDYTTGRQGLTRVSYDTRARWLE